MEGLSLSVRARAIAEEARVKYQKEMQEKEQQDAIKAGPNPITSDPAVLEACLVFLQGKILEAARRRETTVMVPYMEIVPLKERYNHVCYISPTLAKKELQKTAAYIRDEFKRKHPDFDSQSYKDKASIMTFIGDNKYKIEF